MQQCRLARCNQLLLNLKHTLPAASQQTVKSHTITQSEPQHFSTHGSQQAPDMAPCTWYCLWALLHGAGWPHTRAQAEGGSAQYWNFGKHAKAASDAIE